MYYVRLVMSPNTTNWAIPSPIFARLEGDSDCCLLYYSYPNITSSYAIYNSGLTLSALQQCFPQPSDCSLICVYRIFHTPPSDFGVSIFLERYRGVRATKARDVRLHRIQDASGTFLSLLSLAFCSITRPGTVVIRAYTLAKSIDILGHK